MNRLVVLFNFDLLPQLHPDRKNVLKYTQESAEFMSGSEKIFGIKISANTKAAEILRDYG